MDNKDSAYSCYHLIIYGKVQGVFYRNWTCEKAQALDICGWVRNLNQGDVEALFYGLQENVEKLIEACWEGPEYARVENITKTALIPKTPHRFKGIDKEEAPSTLKRFEKRPSF